MSDIWSYPVTFVYGFSEAYGPDFHYGEDRTAPINTPVTVNGVIIGESGNTGLSTGPHTHVGKWQGSQSFNPGGGGALFNSAVVTEVHPTSTDNNGIYVRVQGDDYSWVYLHLSSINVKVGDVLEGGNMSVEQDLATRQTQLNTVGGMYSVPVVDDNTFNQLLANINQEKANAQATSKLADDRLAQIQDLEKQLASGSTGTVLKPGNYTVK